MSALLISLGKYLLASGILFLFYRLVFRKHASFRESRLFLLSITLLALALSQFRIEVTKPATIFVEVEPVAPANIQIGGIPAVSVQPFNVVPPSLLDASVNFVESHALLLLLALYLLVSTLMALNLVFQYVRIQRLRRTGLREVRDAYTLVHHTGIQTPFSAGKTVFLPKNLNENQQEVVLNHERWHIMHRHYIDVFVQEILTCLFWFNPLQWLLRKELRSIHEFEADRSVLCEGTDLYRYQTIILEEVMGNHFRLANGFNQSFTKKRFIQMKNTQSQELGTGRKMLLVPVFTLLFSALCFVPGQSQVVKVEKSTEIIDGKTVTNTSTLTIDTVSASSIALDPKRIQEPGYIQASYLKSLDSIQQMVNKTLPATRKLAASSNPASNAADMNALLTAMGVTANGQGVSYSAFSNDFKKSLTQDDFKQLQKILERTNDSLRYYRAQKVDRMDSPFLLRPVALSQEMMTSSFVSKLFPELFKVLGRQMAGMMEGMGGNTKQTDADAERISNDATDAGKMMGDMMGQLTKSLGQVVQGMTKAVQPEEVVVDTVRAITPIKTIHDQTLINIALNDPSREVRYTALQQIDDQAIILQIAQKDKDMALRAEAIKRLNDPNILSKLAQNDPEPKIRVAALERLAKLKNQNQSKAQRIL